MMLLTGGALILVGLAFPITDPCIARGSTPFVSVGLIIVGGALMLSQVLVWLGFK